MQDTVLDKVDGNFKNFRFWLLYSALLKTLIQLNGKTMTNQSKNSEIDSSERWVRDYKEEMKKMEEKDPEGYSAHPLYQGLKRRVEHGTEKAQEQEHLDQQNQEGDQYQTFLPVSAQPNPNDSQD